MKVEIDDRTVELMSNGEVLVTYTDKHKALAPYPATSKVEFYYTSVEDLKRDRDVFNLFLEKLEE